MQSLFSYFSILLRSYQRLFCAFPMLIRLLLLTIGGGVGYMLFTYKVTPTINSYAYSLGAFVLLGHWLCKPSPKEEILIKSLKLPFLSIQLLKYTALSIPWMILNIQIGFFVLMIGSIFMSFLSHIKIHTKIMLPSFYLPSAYQWISVWRGEGIWIYLLGIFLTCMGINSNNYRLIYFSIVCIICLPCFFAYYKRLDPTAFLTIYKDISFLLKTKIAETLINSLFAAGLCLSIIIYFNTTWSYSFLWITGGCLFGNALLTYIYYAFYPSMIQAIGIIICLLIMMTTLLIDASFYYWFNCLFILPILHIIAHLNLKSRLYAKLKD